MDRRIYALIPAYEPDERLAELCCALKAANCTTVVVDDGSGEGYAALFDGLDVAIVLTHVDNMGKGASLKTGLRYIAELGQPGDIVVTADADGQHTPADILRVAAEAQGAPDALVLGCRGADAAAQPDWKFSGAMGVSHAHRRGRARHADRPARLFAGAAAVFAERERHAL